MGPGGRTNRELTIDLETKLQSHLHDSRRSRSTDLSGGAVSDRGVRRIEIRPIERIEHLPSIGEPHPLPDLEIAMHARVDVEIARPFEHIPAGVAERELRRYCERPDIEPA